MSEKLYLWLHLRITGKSAEIEESDDEDPEKVKNVSLGLFLNSVQSLQ
jgi:hypothetical protein